MALAMLQPGEQGIIQSIVGKEDVKRHLQNLGFVRGETVQVISENASGIVLAVKGTRIALNRGLANRIIVA